MYETLWIDAHLATMVEGAEAYGAVRDGVLAIQDGRIAWIGRRVDLRDAPERLAQEVRSAAGGWITPGLVDCHTHAVFGGNRAEEFEARIGGESYESIARRGGGILSTVRATRSASTEELTLQAAVRLKDLAAEGVTTVEVKSGYGLTGEHELRMLRAARAAGAEAGLDVRGTLLALHAVPPEFLHRRGEYVRLATDEMLPRAVEEGLATAADAFLEGIAFSAEEIEPYFARAQSLGLTLRLHADQLADGQGAGFAARWGAASADHLEYASRGGVAAMAEAGVAAVLLPGAFLVLGESRKPPVADLRTERVAMAVATDMNPGSAPLRSLRLAMHLACVLFGLTPEEALAGATRNAARAMGLQDRGTLAAGLRADLAVWDVEHPAELSYWLGGTAPLRSRVRAGVIC